MEKDAVMAKFVALSQHWGRHRREDNIKMYHREIRWKGLYWVDVLQDREKL